MRNCQIYFFMHVKILLKKNEFVENVWPAKSALFIDVLTLVVETAKQLSVGSERIRFGCESSRVQFPAPARVFMFDLLFCGCVFTFLSQNTLFVTKFCNFFCNISLLSIFNILITRFVTFYKGIKIQTQHQGIKTKDYADVFYSIYCRLLESLLPSILVKGHNG